MNFVTEQLLWTLFSVTENNDEYSVWQKLIDCIIKVICSQYIDF